MDRSIGALAERLLVEASGAPALALASLARSGTTATAVTGRAHGYTTGDYVTIAGATPAGYNGRVKVTVVDTTTFTFTVSGALTSPATGAITGTHYSDAQGGRGQFWRTVDTIWAELVPLRAGERLQVAAIQSQLDVRFRVRTRPDLSPSMRVKWTPRWPPTAVEQTLQILGVVPVEDGRTWMHLECGSRA